MNEKHFFSGCLKAYAKSKAKLLLLLCCFAAIYMLILYLYRIALDAVLYASILCAVIGLACLLLDFCAFYKRHKALCAAASNITITTDQLPRGMGVLEQDYRQLIEILHKTLNKTITENAAAKNHMSDYYTMWVHQIKVPISAMRMLLQEEEKNSPLNIELFKIEQYVEMALSYVRLESDYTDYVLREYDLESIVRQAVRKYAPLFIAKKISLDIAPMDVSILTDEKWLQFVIEQLLSNSLKYTKTGRISIFCQDPRTLVIEDTGIGIAPEDIPRLGEKGFTGYNGRLHKKSTGLGLYLCKEILGRLSHRLVIESEAGKGTRVSIDLESRRMLME